MLTMFSFPLSFLIWTTVHANQWNERRAEGSRKWRNLPIRGSKEKCWLSERVRAKIKWPVCSCLFTCSSSAQPSEGELACASADTTTSCRWCSGERLKRVRTQKSLSIALFPLFRGISAKYSLRVLPLPTSRSSSRARHPSCLGKCLPPNLQRLPLLSYESGHWMKQTCVKSLKFRSLATIQSSTQEHPGDAECEREFLQWMEFLSCTLLFALVAGAFVHSGSLSNRNKNSNRFRRKWAVAISHHVSSRDTPKQGCWVADSRCPLSSVFSPNAHFCAGQNQSFCQLSVTWIVNHLNSLPINRRLVVNCCRRWCWLFSINRSIGERAASSFGRLCLCLVISTMHAIGEILSIVCAQFKTPTGSHESKSK